MALDLYQFQHSEFLLRDIGQRDREPYILPVQNAETSTDQRAIGRVHGLFQAVLRAGWPVTDVDGLPIRATRGTAIQLRLSRVSAFPTAEDAVGAILLTRAQPALLQHRPDQEANARLFRPVAGRGYSGSSSASIASCAITSDTAADLWTIGTAPA